MSSVGLPLDNWLARLETYSPLEIDLGVERVRTLLERLDLELPERVFHIAGTNGKGSSGVMLESLLRAAGVRVGCYTSPHILRYNERIRVDAADAQDAQIVAAFERVEAVRDDVPLTYFEFGTLAALVVFVESGVDAAILEVGMGGRLDAVNAIEPTAGLITNISLDHCEWLGNDIDTIALEKAGIMRARKPIVFASRDLPQGIVKHADEVGARLIAAGRDYDWSIERDYWSWRGVERRLHGLERPSLAGDIQIVNAAGVLALVEAIDAVDLLTKPVIDNAFSSLQLGGRMQRVTAGGNWLLDVAHNPAAAAALANTLRETPNAGRTIAVIGMLDDKDVEGVVRALGGSVDQWLAVTVDSTRAIAAGELARRVANQTGNSCLIAESLQQAIDQARSIAGPADRLLATGSFYLVGPLLSALELYSRR